MHGEHQRLGPRLNGSDLAQHIQASAPRHQEVEEHHVPLRFGTVPWPLEAPLVRVMRLVPANEPETHLRSPTSTRSAAADVSGILGFVRRAGVNAGPARGVS